MSPPSDRPLRIAVGIHSLQLGGSQINTVDLSRELRSRGHDVMIFAIDQPVDVSIEPVAKRAGFDIVRLPAESTLISQARRITEVTDDQDADVVHVYHEDHWLGPLGAIALVRRPQRSLVVTNWMMHNNAWLPLYAPLIVGTEALRDEAEERFQRGPVWLLEPPVDTNRDERDPVRGAAFRREHGFSDSEILIVMVTRVDRLMKVESIFQSMEAVRLLGRRDLRLVIVGDGDAMDDVRRRATSTNAELGWEAVVLNGAMHDPRPAYDAADIVLGMGGSALRGLAFGRPVIVVGEGGFAKPFAPETAKYFLRHGYYGTDEVDDPGAAMAEQIEGLSDPARRGELGDFGSSVVRSRYALDVLAERLEGLYYQAVDAPPNPAKKGVDFLYVVCYDLVHRMVPADLKQLVRRRVSRLRTDEATTPG